MPRFVAAQLAGVLGGFALGLEQIAARPPRHRVVDRAVTRC